MVMTNTWVSASPADWTMAAKAALGRGQCGIATLTDAASPIPSSPSRPTASRVDATRRDEARQVVRSCSFYPPAATALSDSCRDGGADRRMEGLLQLDARLLPANAVGPVRGLLPHPLPQRIVGEEADRVPHHLGAIRHLEQFTGLPGKDRIHQAASIAGDAGHATLPRLENGQAPPFF